MCVYIYMYKFNMKMSTEEKLIETVTDVFTKYVLQ